MLTKKKEIVITGESVLEDGTKVAGFRATINSNKPEEPDFTSWQQDKAAYKANRLLARADEAEFEDYVYSVQDDMISEMKSESEVTE